MRNRAFHVFYLYGIYVTYLSYYLMLFNYFTDFYEPTAFPFILSLFLSGIAHYYLAGFFGENAKFISIIFISPIAIAILYQFHVPWLASLVGLGFAFRGILMIMSEGEPFNKSSLLARSLVAGLFAVILEAGNLYTYDPSPYIVMVIQFFLFFGGYFLSNWLDAQGEGRKNLSIIGQFAVLLSVFAVISFIFSTVMKPLRQFVFYGFTLLLKPFAYLFGPFVQWLIGVLEGWLNQEPPQFNAEMNIDPPVDEPSVIERVGQADFILPLLYIISILLALLIFYRLFKGRKEKIEGIQEEASLIMEERRKIPLNRIRKGSRETAPSIIPVRKAMFEFERKAEKYHNGREKGETIQEWFTRIGFEEFSIIPIYETVRYGDQQISKEDSEKFLSFLQSTLAKWKDEASKENKEKQNGTR